MVDTRPCRPRLGQPLLVLGTAMTLIGGGGVLAYAGWTTGTVSRAFTVHAGHVPRVPQPTVNLVGSASTGERPGGVTPRIRWSAVGRGAGEAVHHYVVTRHVGDDSRVVCMVPATRTPTCLDPAAPTGTTLSYRVTAAHGAHWAGPPSEPTGLLTTPGTPAPPGAAPSGPPASGLPAGADGSLPPPPPSGPPADPTPAGGPNGTGTPSAAPPSSTAAPDPNASSLPEPPPEQPATDPPESAPAPSSLPNATG